MKLFFSTYLPVLIFVAVSVMMYVWKEPIIYIAEMVDGTSLSSYFYFVLLLVAATVFMPVTVMPLIPLAAITLGPFVTGILSIIGWTLGGVIAFLIAQYLGRPFVQRFVALNKIDAMVNQFPQSMRFSVIVLLRLTLPVDVISYAVGLTRSVTLVEYTLATVIGVTWFSFSFAYMGEALFSGNISLLVSLGTVSLAIFAGGWYVLRRKRNLDK